MIDKRLQPDERGCAIANDFWGVVRWRGSGICTVLCCGGVAVVVVRGRDDKQLPGESGGVKVGCRCGRGVGPFSPSSTRRRIGTR